jgi:hypothetical protein
LAVTALAQAFVDAGFQPVADRLLAAVLRAFDNPETITQPELERVDPKQEARLKEVAMVAFKQSPRNWDGAKDALYKLVRKDPDLLWEMFQPYRAQAAQKLLTEAAQKYRQEQLARQPVVVRHSGAGQDLNADQIRHARPALKSADSIASIAPVAQASLLDTFRINGRPLGDLTPEEADKWASSRERDARFVRMLTQNLPPGIPIRNFRTAEDAATIYAQAEKEIGHAV